MSSHFFVIKLKDVIKTLIIAAAAIVILIAALRTSVHTFNTAGKVYVPGTYVTSLGLDKDDAKIAVTVDEHRIKAVELTGESSASEYFYPLLKGTAAVIGDEIVKNQSLSVDVPENASVTAEVIMRAVEASLMEASAD